VEDDDGGDGDAGQPRDGAVEGGGGVGEAAAAAASEHHHHRACHQGQLQGQPQPPDERVEELLPL
jgi:hypothetical protein